MLSEYLAAAMELAQFEVIDDPEPYYGTAPGIRGVWATGETLEECRRNLSSALDDWVLFSVARGQL
jgi:predicted RNase H-like HicB family nuclease